MSVVAAGLKLGGHILYAFIHLQGSVCLPEADTDTDGDDDQGQEENHPGQEHLVHDEVLRMGQDEVHVQQQEQRQHADIFPVFVSRQIAIFYEDFVEISAQDRKQGQVAENIEQPLRRVYQGWQDGTAARVVEQGQENQGRQGMDENGAGRTDGKDVEMAE